METPLHYSLLARWVQSWNMEDVYELCDALRKLEQIAEQWTARDGFCWRVSDLVDLSSLPSAFPLPADQPQLWAIDRDGLGLVGDDLSVVVTEWTDFANAQWLNAGSTGRAPTDAPHD